MKKHLLILASLVFGIGQLFADDVTFSFSDWLKTLPTGAPTQMELPYTWKVSPYHVTATIDKKIETAKNPLPVSATSTFTNYTFTVTVAGAGTLDRITVNAPTGKTDLSASTGTYDNGTWTSDGNTTTVTFTPTKTFRLTSFTVYYTPDSNVTPVDPNAPIEATPIDNVATYDGNDPFVYDGVTFKYYALNNLGKYEEYGVFNKVSTLKSPDLRNAELDYIQTTTAGAYFKTGYIPKANTKAVVKALVGSKGQGGSWRALFGTGYEQEGWRDRFCLFTNTNNDFIAINVEDEVLGASIYDRIANYELDAATGKGTVYDAKGTTVLRTIQGTPKTADCKTELYILAQNKTVPGGEERVDCKNPTVTLFGMKIYEGETLVKDYVPFINADGVVGLKETISGDFIAPDGAEVKSGSVTSYEGKIVRLLTDNHVYQYTDGAWVDKGAMTMEELANTDYKNMNNWETNGDHVGVFQGKIEYTAEGNNFINPYVGTGGHEPLMTKIEVNKGDDYCFSFKASHPKYWSWAGQDHMVHASVWNGYDLWTTGTYRYIGDDGNNILATFAFQYQTEVTDLPVEMDFTAAQNQETLIIQFGDGDDNNNFWWRFNDVKVAKYVYPVAYRGIKTAEANKQYYTELAYIESVSASRENAFTLPYNPVSETQIDTKFMVYDTSNGWCGIFSARNTFAGTGISLYMNGNKEKFGYFTGGTTGGGDNFAPFSVNTDYEVTADVTKLVVNGETYNTGNTVTNATSRNLSIFANPEWDEPMRGRFYYCNISEGGKTIYNFKPVMRHDGVFGFYDEASKVFVLPAQGSLDGYNYSKLADKAYVTYTKETRIVMVGSTAQYLPEVQNLDGATFSWSSADENIATVAADGTVTGVAAGKVTITVTTDADQGWTANYELTVSEPEYKRFDANNVGYAIVTGGTGWNDSPLSALLDNDATTKFGCSGDAWAIIIASEPVAVQQYSFVTGSDTYAYPGRTPRSWKIEGSNDNQTWTVIDEQVQNYKAKTSNKEEFVFNVNGTETYKFFKFSAWDFDNGFQLGEFWINEQTHAWGEPTETASTCTVPGKKVWECTTSKVLKTETLPLAEHAYENGACSCGAKVSAPVILANGATTPFTAKFRHVIGVSDNEYEDIEKGWANTDFDDSAWDEMLMPLGSFGPYKTRWIGEYNTFWFRRPFTIENPAAITKLTLKVTHDDDCSVFLNGKKVWYEKDWTGGENDWRTIDVDPSLLVAGKNVLAVYIEQNHGGAYCDFSLEANVGAKVTVSDAGYATFVAPVDVDFTGSEVTPKAATFDGTYVQLADVTTVPAGTAVVVKAAEGTYTVPATTDAVLGATNELKAATADVTADGTQYILAKQDDKVGFAQATTGTIAAGKGYLRFTTAVKAFYPFAGNDATGISGIEAINGDAPIYNIAGQRLGKMQKGINIVGGKKVLK